MVQETNDVRLNHYAMAAGLGACLGFATLLSLKALGPRWENDPSLLPLVAAVLITGGYWLIVLLLRRRTGLLPGAGKYVMLAAACVTWAGIYVSVKGHDDPPVFALLGAVIWLPALLVYRLPSGVKRA